MYQVNMYITVKVLNAQGHSERSISKQLKIHRNTVRKILEDLKDGKTGPNPIEKEKILDDFKEDVIEQFKAGKTAKLIHDWLLNNKALDVSYSTVARYVKKLKKDEIYIPVLTPPGQESQVDFGYLGRYFKDGKKVKVWVFVMTLGFSRNGFYDAVTDQKIPTFLKCHINAFNYFGGATRTVKIDNLKAGVITPSFFEPVIQRQYAEFLFHYGSAPVTARVGRGQDKGKVEAGVKYVKNNFLKRKKYQDYYELKAAMKEWMEEVANKRTHGTTRKVPEILFSQQEKQKLIPLPAVPFELFLIESRKVDRWGHITFNNNYYSVPWHHSGEAVMLRSNGSILKIFYRDKEIAQHPICSGAGEFISKDEHRPPYKKKKSRDHYLEKMKGIGHHAVLFMEELEKIKPHHWHEMTNGIIHLKKYYKPEDINLSCKRAINYGAISYREVKNILENKLYKEEILYPDSPPVTTGYGQSLSKYDQIIK